jgi:hypothetical protein
MEQTERLQRQNNLLRYLSNLPKLMVGLHGRDNITEFVLYALCQKNCFNLPKAAYFVENPDFSCLKGMTGISHDELFDENISIWDNPNDFSFHMQQAPFNLEIRHLEYPNIHQNNTIQEVLEELAQTLQFDTNYQVRSWPMKHDNRGILLYKTSPDELTDEHLVDGLHLLSFCPVF